MSRSSVSDIKRAQKESQILRIVSELVARTQADEPRLSGLMITKASLSEGKSFCSIYFYCAGGEAEFKEKLEILKLYKPSLRTALAKTLHGRYTPDFSFKFDATFEKTAKIEALFEKLKEENKLS